MARRLGVQVREEVLLREVGYRVRSGALPGARRGGHLPRPQPAAGASASRCCSTSSPGATSRRVYLSPALRRLLERRRGAARLSAARRCRSARGCGSSSRRCASAASSRRRSATTSRASSSPPSGTSRSRSSTPPSRSVNPRVGYATVYRTLKLLKECGLAAERHFDDGQARYEAVEGEAQHHDHIICERCGKIVEFASQELERLQERIGRFLGFVVSRHRMELYGICADCREGGRARPGASAASTGSEPGRGQGFTRPGPTSARFSRRRPGSAVRSARLTGGRAGR